MPPALADLTAWPAERVAALRAVLRGDKLVPATQALEIVRALPHGHVHAALATARSIALDALLPRRGCARMCCCACWPTIWNGPCASVWRALLPGFAAGLFSEPPTSTRVGAAHRSAA